MKKGILMLTAALMAGTSFSQTIFSENFDAGTTLPAGWALYNVDGLTPATNVNYVNAAWVGRPNTVTGAGNHMVSTSWYTPAGVSNDWLVSPSVVIPATGTYFLEFKAMAPDASFPDGFKIWVSTTGNAVSNFTSGTAALTVAAAPTTYTSYSVNLSAYAGQTINFAIQNNSNDMFLLFADEFVVRQPSPDDATLVSSSLNRYSLTSTNNTLGLQVKNNGANAITSLTVDWNDGASHSSVISTNIAPGATVTVNHPTAVNYATANTNNMAISITNVNGNVDPNMADNVGTGIITTLSQAPTKTVLIEEGTGTWCGWCPRGAVAMEYMYNTYPTQFVGIAVHNGDPMTVTAYDSGADLSGYPGCNVDRVLLDQSVSQSAFVNFYNTRKDLLTPASVGLTATAVGSALTVDVNSTFYSNFPAADYRLGVILIEDGVTGTGSGYSQTNYYAGGSNGAMGGYESLPSPVPAAQMVYDHVGRALLGGYDGQVGSVPASLTDGQNVAYTFNYSIPATMNVNNMSAVAVVIDNASGEVVNAEKTDITVVAGVEELASINMTIFPNPATDNINVSFDADGGNYVVTLTDLAGKVVSTNNVSNASGTSTVTIDVANLKAGNYLVAVANGSASYTKMVTIK